MVYISTTSTLESFRRFLINSTCFSFMPESYLRDPEVFPEKEGEAGSIYVEAADKVTLKKIREITFINATDVLGIIYTSKSGNTRLKWRQIRENTGKVSGEASSNSLVNLFTSRVITREYVEELAKAGAKQPQAELVQEPVKLEEVQSSGGDGSSSTTSETLGLEGSFDTENGD